MNNQTFIEKKWKHTREHKKEPTKGGGHLKEGPPIQQNKI